MSSNTDQFRLHCEHVPISEVLNALFQKANAHFILDTALSETITLDLEDVPFGTALRAVCATADPLLVYSFQSGVYRVSAAPVRTPFIPIPYTPETEKQLSRQEGVPIKLPLPNVRPSLASSSDIRWGYREPFGLQMGLWKPAGESVLLCAIRNAGTKPVSYNDYFLGKLSEIKVWARPHGTLFWTQVPYLWRGVVGSGDSAGPSERNLHDLLPGQTIRRTPPDAARVFTGSPSGYRGKRDDAFEIPLNAYGWPVSAGKLDIKITQLWVQKDAHSSVDSGVITLPLE